MGSTRRSFTDEYKRDAVSLILDGGHTIGEVAKKLDICDTSIRKWVNKIQPPRGPGRGETADRVGADRACSAPQGKRETRIAARVRKKSFDLVRGRPAVIFAGIADWADSGEYDVSFMCTQLGVSTAGYYAWRSRSPSARATADAALTTEIKTAHRALHGNPGVRRMWAHLTSAGHRISPKRVHRLMQAADLQGRHPKAWKVTTVAGDNPAPAPDLIGRKFTATEANTRWCGDITYIKTWDGWPTLPR